MRYCIRMLAIISGFCIQHSAKGVDITASSSTLGGRGASATDSATWRFTNPDATDTITFIGRPNAADTRKFPLPISSDPQQKFNVNPLSGRTTFTPFKNEDNGDQGSKAINLGTGSSALVPGQIWGTNAVATWTVTATGTLGTPTEDKPASWRSKTTGKDPWSLSSADIAAWTTETSYDLFFGAGLNAGTLSLLGSFGLSVSYETSSGLIDLLNITATADDVVVTNGSPAGLTMYLMTSMDEGPTENAANIVTLSQIRNLLLSDLIPDRQLNSPLYLGFYLDNLQVPTIDLGDGSVARVHVDSFVEDMDSIAVPEPGSIIMATVSTSLFFLCHRARQKKLAANNEPDDRPSPSRLTGLPASRLFLFRRLR